MKIAIGMETKERPGGAGHGYLKQTLLNMHRASIFGSELLAGFEFVRGEGFTRQQNGMRAIKAGVEIAKTTGAEWVMKLEDDLDFTNNFLENVTDWLADYGHANVPMFSLAATFEFVSKSHFNLPETETVFDERDTAFPRVREYMRRGEHIAPHGVGGYWGAQALVWRTADAEQLVEWLGDDPALFDGKTYHRNRGHDLLLQVWGMARGAKAFGCAVPSFVQHIGRQSNLDQPEIGHKQPFFQFPFAGHDYRYQRRSK